MGQRDKSITYGKRDGGIKYREKVCVYLTGRMADKQREMMAFYEISMLHYPPTFISSIQMTHDFGFTNWLLFQGTG